MHLKKDRLHNFPTGCFALSYTTGTELFDSVFSEDSEFERLLSLDADISAMLDFEIALAKAQAEFGLIPEAHRDAIASATAQYRPDFEELKAGFGKPITERDSKPSIPA